VYAVNGKRSSLGFAFLDKLQNSLPGISPLNTRERAFPIVRAVPHDWEAPSVHICPGFHVLEAVVDKDVPLVTRLVPSKHDGGLFFPCELLKPLGPLWDPVRRTLQGRSHPNNIPNTLELRETIFGFWVRGDPQAPAFLPPFPVCKHLGSRAHVVPEVPGGKDLSSTWRGERTQGVQGVPQKVGENTVDIT
jgi:hypothetical protein